MARKIKKHREQKAITSIEIWVPLLSIGFHKGGKFFTEKLPKHARLGRAQFAAFGEILKKIESSIYMCYFCFRFNTAFLLIAQGKQLDYLT